MSPTCQSCGMPIETGSYCAYCVDEHGRLQDFDTRFERMVQWALREDAALSQEQAEQRTLTYLATMPAWAQHSRVRAGAAG
jgi:Putative zinc ribbon domain